MAFSSNLKAARIKNGLTAVDFVKAISARLKEQRQKERAANPDGRLRDNGLTYTAYMNYESGERKPSFDQLVIMAQLLHVSLDALMETGHTEASDEHSLLQKYLEASLLPGEQFLGWEAGNALFKMVDASYMHLSLKKCQQVLLEAEKNRVEYIGVRFKELMEQQRKDCLVDRVEQAELIIAKAAAASLNIPMTDFMPSTSSVQLIYPPVPSAKRPAFALRFDGMDIYDYTLDNTLDALCFYYFTGCNPCWDSSLAARIVYFYTAVVNKLIDINSDEIPQDVAQALSLTLPQSKRVAFLEEYLAQKNALLFEVLLKQYPGKAAFNMLKEYFLYIGLEGLTIFHIPWHDSIEVFRRLNSKYGKILTSLSREHLAKLLHIRGMQAHSSSIELEKTLNAPEKKHKATHFLQNDAF